MVKWLQPIVLLFMVFVPSDMTGSSEADEKVGDVHVVCKQFVEGQLSSCTCAVNKIETDSSKCSRSLSGGAVTIQQTTTNGVTINLCNFQNFTTGSLWSIDPSANCSLPSVESSVYTLAVSVTGNRSVQEGARVDCRPSCLNFSFQYGLTNSYRGIPITFDPCVPNPCHDRGCMKSPNSNNFTCSCNPGYTGVECNETVLLQESTSNNKDAIVGGISGAIFLVAVLAGSALVIKRKRDMAANSRQGDHDAPNTGDNTNTPAGTGDPALLGQEDNKKDSSVSLPASGSLSTKTDTSGSSKTDN